MTIYEKEHLNGYEILQRTHPSGRDIPGRRDRVRSSQ
jgi:hypothetical protein